jgi:hypothetical protein
MRTIVLLVFCFTLALHGVVQARGIHKPCPMEQSEQGAAVDAATPAQDGCCDDADMAKTDHVCKTGCECPAPNLCAPITQRHRGITTAVEHPARAIEALSPGDTPPSVWRPPALI